MKYVSFLMGIVFVAVISFNFGKNQNNHNNKEEFSKANTVFMTYFVSCIHQLGDPELIDRPESNPLALLYSQECYQKAQAVGLTLETLENSYPKMNSIELLDKALSTVKPAKDETQEEPAIEEVVTKEENWI